MGRGFGPRSGLQLRSGLEPPEPRLPVLAKVRREALEYVDGVRREYLVRVTVGVRVRVRVRVRARARARARARVSVREHHASRHVGPHPAPRGRPKGVG